MHHPIIIIIIIINLASSITCWSFRFHLFCLVHSNSASVGYYCVLSSSSSSSCSLTKQVQLNQCRIKVGAIDAAALGPFVK